MGKKKIGKLLELLNEYDSGWDYDDYWGIYQYGMDSDAYIYHKYYALSKSYGFIGWLVENDKIGDNKNSDRYTMMKLMRAEINEGTEVFEGTERYEFVIMILSIQDEPIEFLVSILK